MSTPMDPFGYLLPPLQIINENGENKIVLDRCVWFKWLKYGWTRDIAFYRLYMQPKFHGLPFNFIMPPLMDCPYLPGIQEQYVDVDVWFHCLLNGWCCGKSYYELGVGDWSPIRQEILWEKWRAKLFFTMDINDPVKFELLKKKPLHLKIRKLKSWIGKIYYFGKKTSILKERNKNNCAD